MPSPRSLFDKIWDDHVITSRDDGTTLLFVDRHFLHEGSRNAFEMLRAMDRTVRRPDLTFAFADHLVPTTPSQRSRGIPGIEDKDTRVMAEAQVSNSARYKFTLFGLDDPRQGIVHVVGPQQGLTVPGLVIVCGDSHTSTHGALGALAFGIGASEVSHVLATQTLWQRKAKNYGIEVTGRIPHAVTSKDLVLAIIGEIGAAGATEHVIEFTGETIRGLSVAERMTICNMSIEAGARAGLISPDQVTFDYLDGLPYAPRGAAREKAIADWKALATEPGYRFDTRVSIDAGKLAPMVTWGTSPEHVVSIAESAPDPTKEPDPQRRAQLERALSYMGLAPGQPIRGLEVDQVFIGSCTNSRIEDLRAIAPIVKGHKVRVKSIIVPGSQSIKVQAEQEGLAQIFVEAGFEWRDSGCSMCLGMNGDTVDPQKRCASTSNRNFEGRQGRGARTHLVSPQMAALAAIRGQFADVRDAVS